MFFPNPDLVPYIEDRGRRCQISTKLNVGIFKKPQSLVITLRTSKLMALKKYGTRVPKGFKWLRIRTSGGLL
jgi:hypothetical protein